MKKLLLIVGAVFLIGCANHNSIPKTTKKTTPIEKQKQEAQKAWKELDKEVK